VDKNRLIVALDLPDASQAIVFLSKLEGLIKKVKIGPALFIQAGPSFIETLQKKGYDIFLDLKLHDIPNTVRLGVKGAKRLGVWMLSVHTSGGRKMLEEAVEAAEGSPLLVGITVLTSFQDNTLKEIGVARSLEEQALFLASLAKETGLNGIVASPQETSQLKKTLGDEMLVVTPGIRWEAFDPESQKIQDDQARTLGPKEALKAGADYLVIGRPILQAQNPASIVEKILLEMEGAIS
jgi:orotidine-5'-phosphate decarboxylase